MVTPFVGTDLPSRQYEFYAHAAPGGWRSSKAGVAVGHLFEDLGLVLQGRYGLAVGERGLDDYARRYSLASAEAAYFLTPSIRLLAMTSARIGHTGIDLFPDSGRVLPFEIFRHHDQISREHYWNIGGGAGYSLTDTLDLFGAFTTTVRGRNTHAINRGLSIGLAWSFGGGGAFALSARDGRESALIKCLCQKAAG
jgi:hypothetical protein